MVKHGRSWTVLVTMLLAMAWCLNAPAASSYATPLGEPSPSSAGADGALPASRAPLPDGDSFHPLVPARVFDTRSPGASRFGQRESREVLVTGKGGVPASGVSAVVLNVTGVSPSGATYLTVWPGVSERPNASTLNLAAGQVRANLVELKVSAAGTVSVFNSAGTVDVLLDVAGWVGPATAASPGGELRALQPDRLLDTRSGVGTKKGVVPSTQVLDLQVSGHGGIPATSVSAVVLNVTSTGSSASAYITAWPTGEARPNASNLNVPARATISNRVIVKVGSGGKISLFHSAGSMHVIADVSGYFTATSGVDIVGAAFTGITPFRAVDTRNGTGAAKVKLGPGQALTVPIAASHGIPGFRSQRPPTAVVANVTGLRATSGTFLTVWPTGKPRPNTSDANLTVGQIVPALVIAKLGADGSITLFNSRGNTDVLVDVLGFYSGDIALTPQAVILDRTETTAISAVTRNTVAFASRTGIIASITTGSIIAAGIGPRAPMGFLRKVSAVHASGGGLIVDTTDATIPDAILFGSVSETQKATKGTIRPPKARARAGRVVRQASLDGGGTFTAPLDHSFVSSGGATVTSSGTFSAGAGVELEADIGWTGLKSASLTAHAEESLDARMDIDYDGSWNETVPLGSVTFEPVTFTVGPLLVEVQPSISAALQGSGSAKGHADASVTQAESVRVGVEYDGDNLSPVNKHTRQPVEFAGPHVSADVDTKLAVETTLNAAFYGGAANLAVGLNPYARIKATECFARLYAGVDGTFHADISILGRKKNLDGDATLAETTLADINLFGPCWTGTLTIDSAFHYLDGTNQGDRNLHFQTTIIAPADDFHSTFNYDSHVTMSYSEKNSYPGNPCSQSSQFGGSADTQRTLFLQVTPDHAEISPTALPVVNFPGTSTVSGPPQCDPGTQPAQAAAHTSTLCGGGQWTHDDFTISNTLIEGTDVINDDLDGAVKVTCKATARWRFTRPAGG